MQKLSEQVQRLSLTSLHPVLDIGYIYIYTYTYYDEFPKGWSCFSSEGCFLKIKKQETCNINVQVAP